MNDDAPARRCAHLRAKTMYIGALAGLVPEDLDAEPPIYWCNRTLRELGPDGESAHPAPCTDSARACYQSPLG